MFRILQGASPAPFPVVGRLHLQSRLVLAPLAGYTDLPFRFLCRELGDFVRLPLINLAPNAK